MGRWCCFPASFRNVVLPHLSVLQPISPSGREVAFKYLSYVFVANIFIICERFSLKRKYKLGLRERLCQIFAVVSCGLQTGPFSVCTLMLLSHGFIKLDIVLLK